MKNDVITCEKNDNRVPFNVTLITSHLKPFVASF